MFKKEDFNNIKPWVLLSLVATALILFVIKFNGVIAFINKFIHLIQPVFYAVAFAYIINLISSRLEKILVKFGKDSKLYQKLIRPIAILIALIVLVIVVFFLLVTILPQLIASLIILLNDMPQYIAAIEKIVNDVFISLNAPYHLDISSTKLWANILPQISAFITEQLPNVIDNFFSITEVMLNIFMGFMMSFYFLMGKETFIRQMKKVVMGIFPKDIGLLVIRIGKQANSTYSNFISGQMLESCILGLLFYIMLTLLQMPYALLISCMVTLLSLVPVAGAIVAWLVGTLLILAIDPLKSLIFLVSYQVLQQFETSVIYPRVVGHSVGLPGAWTLISVFVGAGLFGLPGILLGVPTAAVLYSLTVELINNRLDKNKLVVTDKEVIEKR